jgi:hypothetical protein
MRRNIFLPEDDFVAPKRTGGPTTPESAIAETSKQVQVKLKHKDGKKKDVTLTPGGPRPTKNVHPVRESEFVLHREGSSSVVQKIQQGQFVRAGAKIPEDYILTPGGYRHKLLVHRVDQGQAVTKTEGMLGKIVLSTKALLELSAPADTLQDIPSLGSGWITWAAWSNATGKPISSFTTTWVVPPAPKSQSGQTIFIFNSIEDTAQDDIVQPVLQWGVSAAGGGNYWSIANWYVDPSGHAFYSPLVNVNEGDILTGKITLTGQSGASFNYLSEFLGTGGTALPVLNISELTWATETLECYQISQCSDYPNCPKTPMTSIDLETGGGPAPVSWGITDQYTDCGQKIVVVNLANPGGEVDIIY